LAALAQDELLYEDTRNAHHAWHAWDLARRVKVDVPDWVLTFVDGVAIKGVTPRGRIAKTRDRYQLALTHMDFAIQHHHSRLHRRKVARQLGRTIAVSRRDRPNLSAMARDAAKIYGVSANRLLKAFRTAHRPKSS
jgi:hypothetical protein